MKTNALDQIDTNLEQIVVKLTAAGQQSVAERKVLAECSAPGPNGEGALPPLEFDSLKLAQDTLGLLRRERKTKKA